MRHKKNEELKGGQHKLDKDGDGKITGKDFKILKSKKSHKFTDWVEAKEGKLDEILSWNPMNWGKTKSQVMAKNRLNANASRDAENQQAGYDFYTKELMGAKQQAGGVREAFKTASDKLKQALSYGPQMKAELYKTLNAQKTTVNDLVSEIYNLVSKGQEAGGIQMDEADRAELIAILDKVPELYQSEVQTVMDFVNTEMVQIQNEKLAAAVQKLNQIGHMLSKTVSASGRAVGQAVGIRRPAPRADFTGKSAADLRGSTANPAKYAGGPVSPIR
jgi:hypothetical protein